MNDAQNAMRAFDDHVEQQLRKHDRTVLRVRLVLLLLACGAIAAWAWFGMAGAKADTNDSAFLQTLAYGHVATMYDSPSKISVAHDVCNAYAAGMGDSEIISDIVRDTKGNLTRYDAGYFVGAAAAAYCPQYMGPQTGSRQTGWAI